MKKHSGRNLIYEVSTDEFNLTSRKSQLVFIEGQQNIFNMLQEKLNEDIEKGVFSGSVTSMSNDCNSWAHVENLTNRLRKRNIILKILAYDLNTRSYKLLSPKTIRLLEKKDYSNSRLNKHYRGRFNDADLIPVGIYTYKRKDGVKSSRVEGKRKVFKIASDRSNQFNHY